MKKLFYLLLAVALPVMALAQAPNNFNYQAVVRNSAGQPIVSGPVSLRFSIREGTPTGSILFQETQNKTTTANGMVSCIIGTGNLVSGAYPSNSQWSSGFKYFQVEIDPNGGSAFTDMGSTQIVSVPFANFANGAGTANALSTGATVAPNQLSAGGATNGQILQWNGSNWVPVNGGSGGGSGDITDVVAGTGMTGGGTSGSVTLNAQTSTALWNANKIQSVSVSSSSPTNGQVLQYNGSVWAPATLSGGSGGGITGITAGTGLTGGGTSGTVSITALNTTALWNANMLQGFGVSNSTPTAGKVLKFDGTNWVAGNDSTAKYLAGNGLTLSGSTFNSRWTSRGNDLHNNNSGHVSINSDTAVARFYVKNSTTRNAVLPGANYPFRSSIFGYSDTADLNFLLTSTGVLGFGKGGYTAAGVSGVSGGTGTFNMGLYSQSRVLGPTGTRNYGIYNDVRASNVFGIGIYNSIVARSTASNGIYASYNEVSGTAGATSVGGYFEVAPNNASATNYGIYAFADSGLTNVAGYFDGDVVVAGTLSKSGGTFKIDHPQDPENKYLVHSFVESPDMMNVYNGNIVTDSLGFANVQLPSYFQAENIDFKYQLTVIGVFAQAIVKEEINDNQFIIQTNVPNVKVSWQVTGVRNDKWAQQNRVVPVQEKAASAKGKYLNPEVYGKPRSAGIHYVETAGAAISEKP
jgi:hypothetical protein